MIAFVGYILAGCRERARSRYAFLDPSFNLSSDLLKRTLLFFAHGLSIIKHAGREGEGSCKAEGEAR